MKLKVERKVAYDAAAKAAKILQRGISLYSSCLYLECKDGCLYFSAYSPQMSIVTTAGNVIADQDFECLFQVDSLLPVLQKIKAQTVTFEYDDTSSNLLVKGGSVRLNIRCFEKKQWIGVKRLENPDFEKETNFLFPAISQTKHCLPKTASNTVLSSFVIEQAEMDWKITALDGHRISIRGANMGKPEHTILLDGSSMVTLENIFTDSNVTLMIKKENVAIKNDEAYVYLRSVAGQPFNLANIFTQTPKVNVHIKREELQDIVELAIAAISRDGHDRIILELLSEEEKLIIKSGDQAGNSFKSEINVQMDSDKDIQLALNPKYFLDAIRSLTEEEITMQLTNSVMPVVIKGDNYVELILPVKIS